MEKLFYGIKNGELVSINEVDSGKKCNCTCPSCGDILVAKKGNIRIHHFAHTSSIECKYGHETSLHILAKKIIENAKYIKIPREIISQNYFCGKDEKGVSFEGINDSKIIKIDSVELENLFDDVKPDLVIMTESKKIYVEIFVTHKVDDIKRNKIISQGIDTIEIDLSEYKNNVDEEKLKELLLNSDEKKYWIYNNNVETIINRLEKYYKIKVVRHGFAEHTETCPINSRTFKGESYANVIDDCLYCNKCLKFDDNEVVCAAVTPNYNNKGNKKNSKNKCPVCGGKLKLKEGRFGKFYGCERYPSCKYTKNY